MLISERIILTMVLFAFEWPVAILLRESAKLIQKASNAYEELRIALNGFMNGK